MVEKHRMTITIDGKGLPCYPTMGASLGFKQETGRDIEDMKGSADFAVYLYCCARSACRREKKDFSYTLEEFCDSILLEDMQNLNEQMTGTDAADAKKKD